MGTLEACTMLTFVGRPDGIQGLGKTHMRKLHTHTQTLNPSMREVELPAPTNLLARVDTLTGSENTRDLFTRAVPKMA